MPVNNVLIVGNCLTHGLSTVVKAYLPDATVTNASFTVENIAELATAAASEADVIFAQSGLHESIYPPELREALEPFAGRTILYPRIVFPAFHPDCVYGWSRSAAGGMVDGPFGYHSAIAVEAYRRGYSEADTIGLYNEDTFEALGYFAMFEPSLRALAEECERAHFPSDMFPGQWVGRPFMYTINHPRMFVAWDVGEYLLRKAGARLPPLDRERSSLDEFGVGVQWPIYPEIARRLCVPGDYSFLPSALHEPGFQHKRYDLPAFVAECFKTYAQLDIGDVGLSRPSPDNFHQVESDLFDRAFERGLRPKKAGQQKAHPYSTLAAHQFWRSAISQTPAGQVDPVVSVPFAVDKTTKIATAGSCFAQHIANALQREGYQYYITERAPPALSDIEARDSGYGVFSARYGNIYTARQLAQLIKRAYGEYAPLDQSWRRPDQRYVDPFRPQIEPAGYSSPEDVETSRQSHFEAVRNLVETADVFVFTLGLTEAWRRKSDGAVFPVAPGVAAGTFDPALYEFVNFRSRDVIDDLCQAVTLIRARNASIRFIFTVSPVPLVATFEPKHVLTATTYSKSVLRVAAEEVSNLFGGVAYFPSCEIIAGAYTQSKYYKADLREVRPEGVARVMQLFFRHFVDGAQRMSRNAARGGDAENEVSARASGRIKSLFDIVCEEELLDASNARPAA